MLEKRISFFIIFLGDCCGQYNRGNEYFPPIGLSVTDIEMIKYLMNEHGLTQKDLAPIFGGQGNLSKILNGERSLAKNHILALKKRFKISADFFLK